MVPKTEYDVRKELLVSKVLDFSQCQFIYST